MAKKYPRGSEWRKWDLHLHTPSSGNDYGDQSVTNEQIIETLKNNQISAIAITDHHTIDVDRYLNLRELAGDDITVFPGIELRSELGGRKQIHFIGLFPENLTEQELNDKWTEIQGGMKLTKTAIEGRGGEQVIATDFAECCFLIHELGGLVSVHAGSKENSIEELRNSDFFRQIQKKELTLNHIDIMELGSAKDQEAYRELVFPAIDAKRPLILASDNHNINDYNSGKFVWIKGDITFEGLKQALYEPDARAIIQDDMPEQKLDYLVIDKVRFIDNSRKIFANEWIELNSNLNSIIGGKSSGKSLLLYHVAKTITLEDTENKIKGGDKSIRYDYNLDIDFEVMWNDGIIYKLSDGDEGKDRTITFIPQLYLNALAEEKGQGSDFSDVIDNILSEENAYEVFLAETKAKIDTTKVKLHELVSNFLIIRNNIIGEVRNLKALGDKKAISQSILLHQQSLEQLRKDSKFTEEQEEAYKALQGQLNATQKQLEKLNKQKNLLTKIKDAVLRMSNNVLGNVINPQFSQIKTDYILDEDALATIEGFLNKLKGVLEGPLERFVEEEFSQLETIDGETLKCLEIIGVIKGKLKPFESKLINKTKFDALNLELEGESKKLKAIETKELEIAALRKQLNENEIFGEYQKLYQYYIDILDELQKYSKIDEQNVIELISEIKFNKKRFDQNFSSRISKKTSLNKQFGDMFAGDENEFAFRKDQHIEDVRIIFQKLVHENVIKLNLGSNLDDVVHSLMDDNFYIEYDLKQGDDLLMRMSPGKRGIILFQLFLQLSHATTPILIDQPEDNLDNRTVYQELNNFIKRKKLNRQIIIVSHNANIVVSTDSEEIIVANQHGENREALNAKYRFEYITGSLENKFEDSTQSGILYKKGIRNHVCEILEGGEEAFKKREQKYSLA